MKTKQNNFRCPVCGDERGLTKRIIVDRYYSWNGTFVKDDMYAYKQPGEDTKGRCLGCGTEFDLTKMREGELVWHEGY